MTEALVEAQQRFAILCLAKTGGTALSNFLRAELGPAACFRESQHLPHDVAGHLQRSHLEAYLRSVSSQHRIVIGHLPVGLRSVGPSERFCYATLLREPVARLVSNFFYIHQHRFPEEPEFLNAMLHRTVSAGNDVVYSDPMVRVLTGNQRLVPIEENLRWENVAPVTSADLAVAIEGLRSFAFVGLTERIDDSARMLLALLGRPRDISLPRENVTTVFLPVRKLHPDTIDIIRRAVRLDLQLFAEGVAIFNSHAKKAGLPEFVYRSEPIAETGPISSGDMSHQASAASAFSDRADGVWISSKPADQSPWLGMSFAQPFSCAALTINLPPTAGRTVTWLLQGSDDRFHNDIMSLKPLTLRCDGSTQRVEIEDAPPKGSWRLRLIEQFDQEPVAVSYLAFNMHPAPSRNADAVCATIQSETKKYRTLAITDRDYI